MRSILLIVALLLFLVYWSLRYWRAFLRSASKMELSTDVCALTGLDQANAHHTAYARLRLFLKLCPPIRQRTPLVVLLVLGLARLYYRVLQFLNALSSPVGPHFTVWFHRERLACLHFVAVLLDDRIASNREFYHRYLNNGFHTYGSANDIARTHRHGSGPFVGNP